jgi:Ca-activated chloride channel family protein
VLVAGVTPNATHAAEPEASAQPQVLMRTMPGLRAGDDSRLQEAQLDQLRALGYSGQYDSYDTSTRTPNTESYAPIRENPFRSVADEPLSTFSIDVDTASYANVRRFLTSGQLPPRDAVRIEELVNYFTYDDPAPTDGTPFATRLEVAPCPWTPEHRLVRIGIKGRAPAEMENPGRNLVFLVDVSGSMAPANKLPLVVQSLQLLTRHLDGQDRIAIVTYAGSSGLLLPSTSCDQKATIGSALASLGAGGSTNGAGGIELAYRIAAESFLSGGVNRVILATDGDFNVGITDQGSLLRLIEEKAKSDIFLSVLGFGTGNTKDATMELLADHGNGNYAYIDTLLEAKKVLVDELRGTLDTIAKDVKIQVEFNPAEVRAFRLIGYENRVLAHTDFNDDTKDAGEIGAGHTVTALYEVVPVDAAFPGSAGVDPLKYQRVPARPRERAAAASGELLTVKLRYKDPDGDASRLIEVPVRDGGASFADASADLRFAAAVAAFGMCLRDSSQRGDATLERVYEWAFAAAGPDPFGYRQEFLRLVTLAERLSR